MNYPVENVVVYDLEVYPEYFLFGAKLPDGTIVQFENDRDAAFNFVCAMNAQGYPLAGFNSLGYDDFILTDFLLTSDPNSAWRMSVDIIVNQKPVWDFRNDIRSIDLMRILPGRAGLKKLGVRLGHDRLQELPVPYDKVPTQEERETLRGYNTNDLHITGKLYQHLLPELRLRSAMSEHYGVDLRSKGEATIAEIVLVSELARANPGVTRRTLNEEARAGIDRYPYVHVIPPTWWATLTGGANMQTIRDIGTRLFATPIPIIEDRAKLPFEGERVYIDDRYYAMGVGGLHSVDGPGAWIPGPGQKLIDLDVASYYPSIMLTQGLYPRHWGAAFLGIYRNIVDRRIAAKRAGDKVTADVLKIVANGTFGKASDPFSAIYDPQLLVNVTILGQLALLVLIQRLEGVAKVVSANTDGITVLVDDGRLSDLKSCVSTWETVTGFEMEDTEYEALYQKDVNNYCAVKKGGGVKQKGAFLDKWPDLRHNPRANITATAVTKALSEGIPVEDTIRGCTDLHQFVLTQDVTGNWTTSWHGRPLGKMLRWYKSTQEGAAEIIRTPGKGAKGVEGAVSDSASCIPVEDMPGFIPADLDYNWYIDKANKLLALITQPKRPGMNMWAEVMHRAGLVPCEWSGSYSRARAKYGDVDYTSLPEGHTLGVLTGDNLAAMLVHTDEQEIARVYPTRVASNLPSKTRDLVLRDHGLRIHYGARTPFIGPFYQVYQYPDDSVLHQYYTPGELAKVAS